MTIIQIDEQLQFSYEQFFIKSLFIGALLFIIWALPLTMMYQIGLWLMLLSVVLFSQWQRPQLLAMSTLPMGNDLRWYLQFVQGYFVVPYGETTDIWQGELQEIHDMGDVMVLQFAIVEPLFTYLTFYVWQDQVSDDTWRQLKILAR